MASLSKSLYVVVAGVGSGTGSAVAHRFARSFPVALLARSQSTLDSVVKSIEAKGGKAVGVSADVSSQQSMSQAFEAIKASEVFDGRQLGAAVYNVGGSFMRKSFLDLSLDEFESGWQTNGRGAFLFAHHTMPLLLTAAEHNPRGNTAYSPSLIFTGATASLKGGALASSFATGKFALRALSQSLAREFGPRGVHVSHLVVDGAIDIPRSESYVVKEGAERNGKIDADEIAEAYWNLFSQSRSGWTHELDIRPYVEKW